MKIFQRLLQSTILRGKITTTWISQEILPLSTLDKVVEMEFQNGKSEIIQRGLN
jgi:hypothetical protein